MVMSLKKTTLESDLRLPALSTPGATLAHESRLPCVPRALGGPSQEAYGAGSVFIFRLPRAVPGDDIKRQLRPHDERHFTVAVL